MTNGTEHYTKLFHFNFLFFFFIGVIICRYTRFRFIKKNHFISFGVISIGGHRKHYRNALHFRLVLWSHSIVYCRCCCCCCRLCVCVYVVRCRRWRDLLFVSLLSLSSPFVNRQHSQCLWHSVSINCVCAYSRALPYENQSFVLLEFSELTLPCVRFIWSIILFIFDRNRTIKRLF